MKGDHRSYICNLKAVAKRNPEKKKYWLVQDPLSCAIPVQPLPIKPTSQLGAGR